MRCILTGEVSLFSSKFEYEVRKMIFFHWFIGIVCHMSMWKKSKCSQACLWDKSTHAHIEDWACFAWLLLVTSPRWSFSAVVFEHQWKIEWIFYADKLWAIKWCLHRFLFLYRRNLCVARPHAKFIQLFTHSRALFRSHRYHVCTQTKLLWLIFDLLCIYDV